MNDAKVYLYTIRDDGTISVREGEVSRKLHNWQRTLRFTPTEGDWCYVSSEPCTMYYRKVWMPKRDDELAKELCLEYHERKIKECERTLEMHRQAIATLKEIDDGDISL